MGGDPLTRGERPEWWAWELELSAHLLKRMADRQFTELELRAMLDRASEFRADIAPGRWVADTRHRRGRWEVILEPDFAAKLIVVVTAYPVQ